MHILFAGEANAARTIIAEALLRRLGGAAFEAYSAGRNPALHIHAHTLETLKQAGYVTDTLSPKSWQEFVRPTAPALHVVVTMDEALKRGPFPIWFSNPVYVHWPYPNPQTVGGDDMERRGVYRRLYSDLEQQILRLTGMNLKGLSSYALKDKLDAIAPKF
ncbi:MAG: hypothetical protein NUV50_11635 [Rhodospirillales bacterium]|nr:hypothetical protein [Rhodospirillales bacterium]